MNNISAILRDGSAIVITSTSCKTPDFPILGRHDGDGRIDLWRADGRWRTDGPSHPHDITHVVTLHGTAVPFKGIAQ